MIMGSILFTQWRVFLLAISNYAYGLVKKMNEDQADELLEVLRAMLKLFESDSLRRWR